LSFEETAMFKKSLMVGIATLTMGGAMITTSTPAQAQFYYGHAPAYYGGYYGHGYYGHPVGYGGYYGGGYGYHRPYVYHRRRNNGAAVAAGLIGGLALGAIAAQAARPAYYRTCYTQPQRVVNRRGRVSVRNVQVCR
jgi:hypothetical protein